LDLLELPQIRKEEPKNVLGSNRKKHGKIQKIQAKKPAMAGTKKKNNGKNKNKNKIKERKVNEENG